MQEPLRTVFLIMMENHNWSDIKQNSSAPYINQTLLPMASYAEQYYNPPGIHPSEPNYLWLEAGTNFGVTTDDEPNVNHRHSTQHLVTLLDQAGISWKSYQEDIDGTACPIQSSGLYATKHNPMVFFDDVTDTNDPTSSYCISHVRPFSRSWPPTCRTTPRRATTSSLRTYVMTCITPAHHLTIQCFKVIPGCHNMFR